MLAGATALYPGGTGLVEPGPPTPLASTRLCPVLAGATALYLGGTGLVEPGPPTPVSYTHLDVYKRQEWDIEEDHGCVVSECYYSSSSNFL